MILFILYASEKVQAFQAGIQRRNERRENGVGEVDGDIDSPKLKSQNSKPIAESRNNSFKKIVK